MFHQKDHTVAITSFQFFILQIKHLRIKKDTPILEELKHNLTLNKDTQIKTKTGDVNHRHKI